MEWGSIEIEVNLKLAMMPLNATIVIFTFIDINAEL